MSLFRGQAERLSEEGGSNDIVYGIEKPEIFKYTNNQKKLIKYLKACLKYFV